MYRFQVLALLFGLIQFCLLVGIADSIVCNNETEFLCKVDEKCIGKERVCNFYSDCSDSQDESRCGACNFKKLPEECGLTFESDRLFSWYRKGTTSNDYIEELFYMQAALNAVKRQYINRIQNNWHLIYRPRIFFPQLGPTDNEECRFSLEVLVSKQSAVLELQSERKETPDRGGGVAPSWPQVYVMLIKARDDDLSADNDGYVDRRKSYNLGVKERSSGHHDEWFTYEVKIGAQTKWGWSLELLVESWIQSYMVQVNDFKYVDCEPSSRFLKRLEKAKLDANATNAPGRRKFDDIPCRIGQFKCLHSGLCIDRSFVCDFGYDCGQDDSSDEQSCDDFLGRCDFEQSGLCNWMPTPRDDTWMWMSALDEDQLAYRVARPRVDHTFRSSLTGGHYLLLNSSQLKEGSQYSLFGPRISLRSGARECYFRFWYYTPKTLELVPLKSAYFSLGRQRFQASSSLFSSYSAHQEPRKTPSRSLEGGLEVENMDWKRFEMKILDHFNVDERSIDELRISFGGFETPEEVKEFKSANGYIALDDFSFSPGCALTFLHKHSQGSLNESEQCGENQFRCQLLTPVTKARCIPLINYCDFKNDCTLKDADQKFSSDEFDCPHECNFRPSERGCSIQVMDDSGRAKEERDRRGVELENNDEFSWNIMTFTSSPALERSLVIYHHYINSSTTSSKYHKHSKYLELVLPTFSGSHGNCSFQLVYEWSQGTDDILYAQLSLENLLLFSRTTLRIIKPVIHLQTLTLGLGQQKSPFRLRLKLATLRNLTDNSQLNNSFSIRSYRFTECSFFPGLIDPSKEIEFDEDFDDDYGFAADNSGQSSDYINSHSELGGPADYQDFQLDNDTSCQSGYFPCNDQIVCIHSMFSCDMQRDCQSGSDELQTRCSGQIRFNFDDTNDESALKNWIHLTPQYSWTLKPNLLTGSHSTEWEKKVNTLESTQSARVGLEYPPLDHSRADQRGRYLLLSATHDSSTARLRSPRFKHFNSPLAPHCRLVFYLYTFVTNSNEQNHSNQVRVFKRVYEDGGRRSDRLVYESNSSTFEKSSHWQRISVELEAKEAEDEFSLIFEGALSKNFIALDDISLGLGCTLSSIISNSLEELEGPQELKRSTGSGWLVSNVGFLLLLLILVAAFGVNLGSRVIAGGEIEARALTNKPPEYPLSKIGLDSLHQPDLG